MADVATIGLMYQRNSQEQASLSQQLQTALDSRVVIEQAKGMLAAHTGATVNDAFSKLRAYARRNNLSLTDVAASVVDQSIVDELVMSA